MKDKPIVADYGFPYGTSKYPIELNIEVKKFFPKCKIAYITPPTEVFGNELVNEFKKPSTNICFISLAHMHFCIQELAEKGFLMPLDELLPKKIWFGEKRQTIAEKINENLVQVSDNIFNGHIYGIPKNIAFGTLFYRKDILDKYGFLGGPKTWEELIFQCSEMLKNGKNDLWGYMFRGGKRIGENFIEYLWSNGGDIFDTEKNLIINSKESAETLDFFHKLIHKYKFFPKDYLTRDNYKFVDDFMYGKGIFLHHWTDAILNFVKCKKSKIKNKFGYMLTPIGPSGKNHFSLAGGGSYVVPKNTKYIEIAKKLFCFFSNPKMCKNLDKKWNWPFSRFQYVFDEPLQSQPYYIKFNPACASKLLSNGRFFSSIPFYYKIYPAINKNVSLCLSGEIKIKDALKNMENEIESIINERKYSNVIKKGTEFMKNNFEKSISLSQISEYVGLSHTHFAHIFKKETGQSAIKYLQDIRLKNAIRLLKQYPNVSVKKVAYESGITDPKYFARIFKRLTGTTPEHYKNSCNSLAVIS
ncbi:MAG: extracellular solute-binding protein [Candidatus Firestonebacteria bacterium]